LICAAGASPATKLKPTTENPNAWASSASLGPAVLLPLQLIRI